MKPKRRRDTTGWIFYIYFEKEGLGIRNTRFWMIFLANNGIKTRKNSLLSSFIPCRAQAPARRPNYGLQNLQSVCLSVCLLISHRRSQNTFMNWLSISEKRPTYFFQSFFFSKRVSKNNNNYHCPIYDLLGLISTSTSCSLATLQQTSQQNKIRFGRRRKP